MIESIAERFEKKCENGLILSESQCIAKSFVTEEAKKKFYENIRSTEKAHERIDSHLLSHKNIAWPYKMAYYYFSRKWLDICFNEIFYWWVKIKLIHDVK